jgi:hypothetical protein
VSGSNGIKEPRSRSTAVDVKNPGNGEISNERKAEEADPWSLPELTDTGVPWSGKLNSLIFQCLLSIIFNAF